MPQSWAGTKAQTKVRCFNMYHIDYTVMCEFHKSDIDKKRYGFVAQEAMFGKCVNARYGGKGSLKLLPQMVFSKQVHDILFVHAHRSTRKWIKCIEPCL